MTTEQIKKVAYLNKPSAKEIAHLSAVTPGGIKHQFSCYLSEDGNYKLAQGMIFNERQAHSVLLSTPKYSSIANFITSFIKKKSNIIQ